MMGDWKNLPKTTRTKGISLAGWEESRLSGIALVKLGLEHQLTKELLL